jgi:DNA-binding transcriptional LysR family regulator
VTPDKLREHEFSVPAIGDRGTPMDNWPVELPRRIGFQIQMLSTNLRVSLSGRFVTVLPDVVAAPELRAGRLWRLDPDVVPDTEIFAACREEDSGQSFTAFVIREVAERAAAAPHRARK